MSGRSIGSIVSVGTRASINMMSRTDDGSRRTPLPRSPVLEIATSNCKPAWASSRAMANAPKLSPSR
jgi:hypothetical protein